MRRGNVKSQTQTHIVYMSIILELNTKSEQALCVCASFLEYIKLKIDEEIQNQSQKFKL